MLKIEIETDNAAFSTDPGAECARILRQVAGWVEVQESCYLSRPVRDANGNRVGQLTFDPLGEGEA